MIEAGYTLHAVILAAGRKRKRDSGAIRDTLAGRQFGVRLFGLMCDRRRFEKFLRFRGAQCDRITAGPCLNRGFFGDWHSSSARADPRIPPERPSRNRRIVDEPLHWGIHRPNSFRRDVSMSSQRICRAYAQHVQSRQCHHQRPEDPQPSRPFLRFVAHAVTTFRETDAPRVFARAADECEPKR
jgi:hypothetical protein